MAKDNLNRVNIILKKLIKVKIRKIGKQLTKTNTKIT